VTVRRFRPLDNKRFKQSLELVSGAYTRPMTSSPSRKRGRGADTDQTKRELIAAAFESLRHDGFRGSTARAIATRASCNQAAIYYHFGGIEQLWLRALSDSSELRLNRYRDRLSEPLDLPDLVAALEELYDEDQSSGHLDVLTELMGGVTANPEVAEGVAEATTPWLNFVEAQVQQAAAHHPLGPFVPAADLADLVFSLVVGVQLRNRVDGRTDRAERVFRLASLGASLAGGLSNDT